MKLIAFKKNVYLKGGSVKGRENMTEKDLQWPNACKSRAGPGQSQEPGVPKRLSHGWLGPGHLSRLLLPFRLRMSRKLESEAEQERKPRHITWAVL